MYLRCTLSSAWDGKLPSDTCCSNKNKPAANHCLCDSMVVVVVVVVIGMEIKGRPVCVCACKQTAELLTATHTTSHTVCTQHHTSTHRPALLMTPPIPMKSTTGQHTPPYTPPPLKSCSTIIIPPPASPIAHTPYTYNPARHKPLRWPRWPHPLPPEHT